MTDPSAKRALEGKVAARTHDAVNVVLVLGLLLLTTWCFALHSPFQDSLKARAASASLLGFDPADLRETSPVFFWLAPVTVVDPSWAVPAVYVWLTKASLAYAVFDLGYIFVVPACTTRFASIVLHHFAVILLTSGALYFKVEPLSALCLLVEINTIVLTVKNLKRAPAVEEGAFSKAMRTFAAKTYDFLGPRLVDSAFMFTWASFRLIFYPFLLLCFHRYFGHVRYAGIGYVYALCPIVTLNVLNQWWTSEIAGIPFVLCTAGLVCAALNFFC